MYSNFGRVRYKWYIAPIGMSDLLGFLIKIITWSAGMLIALLSSFCALILLNLGKKKFMWVLTIFHLQLGELSDAEDALAEANILNNSDPEVWAYLALVCLRTRRQFEAEQAYKYAIKVSYRLADIWIFLMNFSKGYLLTFGNCFCYYYIIIYVWKPMSNEFC